MYWSASTPPCEESRHVPLFKQGADTHSLTSTWQLPVVQDLHEIGQKSDKSFEPWTFFLQPMDCVAAATAQEVLTPIIDEIEPAGISLHGPVNPAAHTHE